MSHSEEPYTFRAWKHSSSNPFELMRGFSVYKARTCILEARWQSEQVTIDDSAVEMIQTITASNLQKLVNISSEMRRVCQLNSITIITADLVKVASKTLLLSTSPSVNS